MTTPSTLADLVGDYLVEQCNVLLDAPAPLRAGKPVVHTTRVAVRRLRSSIRVFADLVEPAPAAALEAELVWWAGLLGRVRDFDILGERLVRELAELPAELVLGPVASHIQLEIGAARKAAFDEVLGALDGDRYAEFAATLERWAAAPPFTAASAEHAEEVASYLKRARKKVEKRLSAAIAAHDAGDSAADELLHSARKAAKRHRYAVEAAQPLWGAKADKTIAQRKDLQDVLGGHQDSVVGREFLRELGAQVGVEAGHNGFTYGLLYAREEESGRGVWKALKRYLG